ncbi:succinate dehydrogenase/fumarate reductase iron-sulfur subunit [Melissospora conviva]|uniref:succinate dehydrogenase/fumarate reductase iron-sulfur subunit n=1 Tax=Melissospora conviva TaxID=3388432 RepID=UPI003B7A841B
MGTSSARDESDGTRQFRIWRGDADGGGLRDYRVQVNEGEVVLDVIHRLQATEAPDLACRWNCKAGKCGSCSVEINGMPKLACMTRMSTFAEDETVSVTPLRTFPIVRDLVTDVSFNYTKARETPAFAPPPQLAPGEYRMQQVDVERSQEFRKCIECFLCQDTCHVIRDHEPNKEAFAGPRYFIRAAELDMHPLDARTDRQAYAQSEQGLGFCNITKCCTEVCPEHIKITDNAIIPMKERVVDRRYDPIVRLGSKIFRRGQDGSPAQGGEQTVNTAKTPTGAVHSHAGGSHDQRAELEAQRGVNWHREVPRPSMPAVDAKGKLPLTELTFDRPAAPSPFGDDVKFPLPVENLNFAHPQQDS